MSLHDENEIDKAFRKGIEKMKLVPPPIVWDGVRASALQQQLSHVQTTNAWLKLLSAVLGIAFLGSIYLYQNKTILLPTEKTTVLTKTDTVYVTKTEKVYVPVYQKSSSDDNLDSDESLAFNQSSKLPQNESILANNESVENQHPSKNEYPNQNELVSNKNEKSDIAKKTNSVIPPKENLGNDFAQNAASPATISTTAPIATADVESGTKEDEKTLQNLDVISLTSKDKLTFEYKNQLPEVEDFDLPPFRVPRRFLRGNAIDWSKFSLMPYYSFDANTLTVKNANPSGAILKEQNLSNEYSYGIRFGVELSPKLSLITGFESSYSSFRENNRETFIIPEFHQNAPSFPHETSLGTCFIPNDGSGNKFQLKTGDHQVTFLRIPLLAKYYFYQTRMSVFKSNYHDLRFYLLGGGYWNFAMKQQLPAEMSTANGSTTSLNLTNFEGVEKNFYGLNLGIGVEYNFLKKMHFYLEPNYKSSITPVVNDTPLKTLISGYGLSAGLRFQL